MSAVALPERIRKRLADWKEDGRPPITLWNWNGRRRLIIGGRHTGGWMITPRITLDPRHITVGVTWEAPGWGVDEDDPDPSIGLHLPGIYLWARIIRVHPGYLCVARARRDAA